MTPPSHTVYSILFVLTLYPIPSITTSQPSGTVAIGGHSLGGLLAIESAMTLAGVSHWEIFHSLGISRVQKN